jgi:hypothetical protein
MENISRTDIESWGERVPPEKFRDRQPVVFNFRPTGFILVDEEHRDDWKKLFDEHADVPAGEMLRIRDDVLICLCVCETGVDDFDSY